MADNNLLQVFIASITNFLIAFMETKSSCKNLKDIPFVRTCSTVSSVISILSRQLFGVISSLDTEWKTKMIRPFECVGYERRRESFKL